MELRSVKSQTRVRFAKPGPPTGSLWNTLVCAAKGKKLWRLGWQCFPELLSLFERLKKVIDTAEELRVVDEIYEVKSCRNFSSHLLRCVPERFAVIGDAECPLE